MSGLARDAIERQRRRDASDQSDRDWWGEISPVLTTAMAGRDYPIANRVSSALGEATGQAADPEGALQQATEVLLAGLGSVIQGR